MVIETIQPFCINDGLGSPVWIDPKMVGVVQVHAGFVAPNGFKSWPGLDIYMAHGLRLPMRGECCTKVAHALANLVPFETVGATWDRTLAEFKAEVARVEGDLPPVPSAVEPEPMVPHE